MVIRVPKSTSSGHSFQVPSRLSIKPVGLEFGALRSPHGKSSSVASSCEHVSLDEGVRRATVIERGGTSGPKQATSIAPGLQRTVKDALKPYGKST